MWLVVLLCVGLSSSALVAPAWAQTSLLPDAAPPGATVTISGKGFGQFQSAEQNRVFFNNVPALIQRWETDFIEAKVPHQASNGPVSVVTGTKRVSAGNFTIVTPHIQSLGPEEIVRGKVLQITGRHFGNTAGSRDPNTMFGVNEVRIGGVKANIRKWRDDKIEVVVPATAKSGDVVVRLASSDPLPNGYCCAPVAYTVSNSMMVTILPTIRVEPRRGPVGTKVVLFGAGFGSQPAAGDLVLLNGNPMTIAEWKNKSIVVHVPLNATSGPLVLRQGGRERQLGSFTVNALKVTTLSQAAGPIGSLLRIRGENFGNYTESGAARFSFLDFDPGDNKVTIGGVPAIVYRWNDDLIDVWVPFSAKGGRVVVQRGGTIPKADGSCCVDRGVVSAEAGSFSVLAPKVESVTPMAAGIDEVITIKGEGFGSRLKTREATDPALGKNAFLSKPIRLSENISRTEVLFNGVAAVVVSWKDSEIQVQVPRRLLYGIGSAAEFQPDLSKGPLVIRRGSWDLLPDGTCCSEKKWLTVDAGEFTIMAKGLPDQGFFNDPNQSYP
jgi:hypothetical protein